MSPLPGINQSYHDIVSVDGHHGLLVQHFEPFHNGRHEVSGNVLGKADRDIYMLAEVFKRLLSQRVTLPMEGERELIVQKKVASSGSPAGSSESGCYTVAVLQ
jgi:hypothetical protein